MTENASSYVFVNANPFGTAQTTGFYDQDSCLTLSRQASRSPNRPTPFSHVEFDLLQDFSDYPKHITQSLTASAIV
ncbi:hypothetical protein HanIR_Chr04g0170551 [Helianthus annuus]|nr:hypothetical protein HanIR_Chr04g0170551 [Helianthus annuus]